MFNGTADDPPVPRAYCLSGKIQFTFFYMSSSLIHNGPTITDIIYVDAASTTHCGMQPTPSSPPSSPTTTITSSPSSTQANSPQPRIQRPQVYIYWAHRSQHHCWDSIPYAIECILLELESFSFTPCMGISMFFAPSLSVLLSTTSAVTSPFSCHLFYDTVFMT